MFNINVELVNEMTDREKKFCEITYLDLAYTYESEEGANGSRLMSKDPASILFGISRAERKLMNSYRDLFDLGKDLKNRTGEQLIGFVRSDERTPENALDAWYQLYRKIND